MLSLCRVCPVLTCFLGDPMNKETLRAAAAQFATAFASHAKSQERAHIMKAPDSRPKARAACKMQAEAAAVWGRFQGTLPNIMEVVEGCACNPFHVGVQNGSVAASCEGDYLASFRIAATGSRTILAIPMSLACRVFGNQSPSALWGKFMSATANDIAELTKGLGSRNSFMYTVTHGPGDIFYLPAGWVFVEKITAQTDMLGMFVRGLVLKDAEALSELGMVHKLLELGPQTPATSAELKKLDDVMRKMIARRQMQPIEAKKKEAAERQAAEQAKEAERIAKEKEAKEKQAQEEQARMAAEQDQAAKDALAAASVHPPVGSSTLAPDASAAPPTLAVDLTPGLVELDK